MTIKKKIIKSFRKLLSGCKKVFKKVIDFVTGKKEPSRLENHYSDPIYLLFPDKDKPEDNDPLIDFEGPGYTGSFDINKDRENLK